MPQIGRPDIKNVFQGIKKASGSIEKSDGDLAKKLNRIAGIKEEEKFVDKKEHNKMDKDIFLKLLANQLKNQNPFNPVEQKEFATDLAQFSQLEQLASLNRKFDKSTSHAPHQIKFMGASFLGKKVLTSGTSIKHKGDGQSINLPFILKKPAKEVMVRVFDQQNNLIAQIELAGRGKGSQSVLWDGQALDGVAAKKGTYRFEVKAWDDQFNEFKGETRTEGTVTDVYFEGNEVVLTVDGNKVYLRDVDSFSLTKDRPKVEKSAALRNKHTQAYNQ